MSNAAEHLENMCDGALKAAETAVSLGERIMHLEKACEYAKMAAAERKRSNVYEIISHGR